jgi:hypothetical protein
MDEDVLNMEIRKFLKLVGVTSQREIETAVRAAASSGRLKEGAKLGVTVSLAIPGVGLAHEIKGEIAVD